MLLCVQVGALSAGIQAVVKDISKPWWDSGGGRGTSRDGEEFEALMRMLDRMVSEGNKLALVWWSLALVWWSLAWSLALVWSSLALVWWSQLLPQPSICSAPVGWLS